MCTDVEKADEATIADDTASEEEESTEGDDQDSEDTAADDQSGSDESGQDDADASEAEAPAEDDADPAEDDAAPAEDPADNDNEAEESDASLMGDELMDEGDETPAEQTITWKVVKSIGPDAVAEVSDAVDFEFTGGVTETDGKATVDAGANIEFTVAAKGEYVLVENPVTATAGGNDIDASKITPGNNGAYTITNSGDDTLTGNVVITITVADKTYVVNAPGRDAGTGITWKIKKSTDSDYNTDDASKVSVTKTESVTVQATLEKGDNKDTVEVTLNEVTKELKATAEVDGTAEFTIAAADLFNADGAVKTLEPKYVVKSKVAYTLTAPDDEDVTVTIKDAKGTAVTAATEGDNEGKYELINGDTYTIEIKDGDSAIALTKLASVKANGEALPYKNGFSFEADDTVAEANRIIEVALKAAAAHTITVVMDGNDADAVAKIKADAFKTTGNADAADPELVEKEIAANTTYAVWEGTDLSFTLAAKNTPYYKIDKVELIKNDETTELTGTNGKYTIAKVDAAATVKIYTSLDETQAYSITFTDADGNVQAVQADLKGAEAYQNVDANKAIKFMPGADKEVKFKVTAYGGYDVKKVASGTTDVPVEGAEPNKVYTYTFDGDSKAATITINTGATELTTDKYVEFRVADGVDLAITNNKITKVEAEGTDGIIYKLPGKVEASGDAPAVEGVSELPFTLTIPYGYTLNGEYQSLLDDTNIRQIGEREKANNKWTYTYKAAADQLTDDDDATLGSKEHPYVITVSSPEEEMVALIYAESNQGTAQYKILNPYENFGFEELTGGEPVYPGDTVILQVEDGDTLKVDGEDAGLDAFNKYSFVAKLDDTKDNESTHVIDVQNAAAGEYTLKYAVNPDDVDDISYDRTVGKDDVDVAYNDKVYLSLTAKNGSAANISRYETSPETPNSKVKTAAGGKAEVEVLDAKITLTLYTEVPNQVGSITVIEEDKAAEITLTCKDASGKTLTAKGLKNNGTIKLDATSTTSYALTLKEGKTTLNVAEYAEALDITYDTPGVVRAAIVGSDLKVDTLKDAKAKITISAKDGTPLLTFTVDGQKPALKVKSVTSVNQGMHDILLDVAADASIKPIAADFELYYEVNVKKKDGDSTNNIEGFYYLAADELDAKGKIAPVSQLFKVNGETDPKKFANTYTFTARLVAVASGATIPTSDPKAGTVLATALDEQTIKYASTASIAKDFKTRAEYYEDKLSVTKKTTKFYAGEQDVLVAIPKFSKNASHIEDIEAVVYNKDGSQAVGVWAEDVENDSTMAVKVSSETWSAGNYDVVIYATATKDGDDYNMYQASAKVPITVQKGINWITVDCPSQIAQVADSKGNKKDVSVTLKATGWYGEDYNGNDIKAQTQKFTYELGDVANSKNADQVVVKNNKITVKKGFITGADPDDNYFTVLVKAADYADGLDQEESIENGRTQEVCITVTDKALEIGSVELMTWDDSKSEYTPAGETISTTDLDGAQVKITDTNGQRINSSLVTLTPNKGKVHVDSDEGEAYIVAEGYQKNLTIKAVTKDGGKKSKSSMKYTITYPEGPVYSANLRVINGTYESESNVTDDALLNQTGDRSWTYKGNGNNSILFDLRAKVGDSRPTKAYTSDYNYTVKVTGGKNISTKESVANGYYIITPSTDEVKVTVTDKTKKASNTTEFTIKDTNWQTAAAPKASTKDKLYYAKNAADGSKIAQSMTYTVTAKNASYKAVKLTCLTNWGIGAYSYELPITDNTFKLEKLTPNGVGTTKYSAVYGHFENDVFYPETKAATLSIKVNKAGNPKAVNKYTINPSVSMSVPLQAKPVPVEGMVKFNKVLSANVKGEKNKFYDYFAVSADGKSLEIRTDKQTTDGLKELNELGKEHLNGYLEYQYRDATTGNLVKKQDKITVVINNKAIPKYTATNVDVVTAATVTADTTVKLGTAEVPIAQVTSGTDGWTAVKGSGKGVVTLSTTEANLKSGKVDIHVIPEGSSNAAETSADKIKELGVKVQVTVNVKDDTKGSKLTIAKGAKTPVASISGSKVNLTVTLEEGTDFSCSLSNVEIVTAAKVADLTKISKADDKKAAEAVSTVGYAAGKITIVLDRDGLDPNKQYNVPVDMTFTAGNPETVYFSVKTQKIPTMSEIISLVGDKMAGFAVTSANYNNATEAAKEVEDAAKAIEIPALSGIEVTSAAAIDTDDNKFADSQDAEGKDVKGNHKIMITLTDVTKAADATDKTAGIEIAVTEKTATKSLGAALSEALEKYALPGEDGKVADGKIDITTANPTRWTVQKALQDAADSVEKGKYNVSVIAFDFETTNVPDPTPASKAVKVTNLIFSYTVKDAMTGDDVEEKGKIYRVDVEKQELGVPTVTEPVDPNPNPGESEENKEVKNITLKVTYPEGATNITQGTGGTVTFEVTVTAKDGSDITDTQKDNISWSVTPESSAGVTFTSDSTDNNKATLVVSNEASEGNIKVTATLGEHTQDATVEIVAAEEPEV